MDIVFMVLALIAILEAGAIIWLLVQMKKEVQPALKPEDEDSPPI